MQYMLSGGQQRSCAACRPHNRLQKLYPRSHQVPPTVDLQTRSYASHGGNNNHNSNVEQADSCRKRPTTRMHVQSGVGQLAQRLQQRPWVGGDGGGIGDVNDDDLQSSSPLDGGGPSRRPEAPWSPSHRAASAFARDCGDGTLYFSTLTTKASRLMLSQAQHPPQQRQQQQQNQHRRPFVTVEDDSSTTATAAVSGLVAEALAVSATTDVMDLEDDDIVLDTPAALLPCVASAAATQELRAAHHRQKHAASLSRGEENKDIELCVETPESNAFAHPASRGVGQDVVDLVTDAFTTQREAEVRRRREVLYELTHPNPADYTYNGKLVPPPPFSFGQVTEEARSLGNKMMLGQTYSLVRQAGTRASEDDFCGTIYTSNCAGQQTANRLGATTTTVSPASTIETTISGPSSVFSQQPQRRRGPYRSHAREDNIFRDHNYFFEVNDLYQEIVLVGKACAGKSSLLNSLLGRNVAKTSSSPNTTRKISFYQSVTPEQLHAFHVKEHHNQLVKLPGGGLQLTFVDMPGYGIEGMSDKWRDAAIELTDAYFGVRRSVNTVLYCMDCERGLTKTDIKYFEWLENVQGTFFVVLTKCDSVPHSRITSVMRQVYALITKNRRKYRKVFPFIIPTSAKDGTNMELLRGLITETSGMIPGDKLRDLLKQKNEAFTHTALLEEASRIDAVRQLERAQAKKFFQLSGGHPVLKGRTGSTGTTSLDTREQDAGEHQRTPAGSSQGSTIPNSRHSSGKNYNTSSTATIVGAGELTPTMPATTRRERGPQRYVLHIGGDGSSGSSDSKSADLAEPLLLSGEFSTSLSNVFPTTVDAEAAAAQARRERRERFLAWRRTHPLSTVEPSYGDPGVVEECGEENASAVDADLHSFTESQASSIHRSGGEREKKVGGRPHQQRQGAAAATARIDKGRRYRLHTGLDNPQTAHTVLDVPGDDRLEAIALSNDMLDGEIMGDVSLNNRNVGAGANTASLVSSPAPPIPSSARSSVIGFTPGPPGAAPALPSTSPSSSQPSQLDKDSNNSSTNSGGAVSQFLNVLADFGQQPNIVRSAKQRRKEAQWQRKQKGRKNGCGSGGLLAEDANGRLSPYQAGKPCGPAVLSLETSLDRRQAKWRAEQLKTLLTKENPAAPWQAMQQLRRKVQARQEEAALSGMRKKEVAAYLRNAGRVTESFDRFEGEVTAAKYMNEIRQAPTLRSQVQMHLNATAKINYRSMPPGLWKRYGEKETYWPTPRVLGRAQDESHKP